MMKTTSYKTCSVPMCRSTTIKCPNKLFIHVPKCPKRRKQWIQLARKNPDRTSDKSVLFFCEDHFDLPRDMENYIQYGIMGSVGLIKMIPNCLPSKFECQDTYNRTAIPRLALSKRQHIYTLEEIVSGMLTTSSMTSNSGGSSFLNESTLKRLLQAIITLGILYTLLSISYIINNTEHFDCEMRSLDIIICRI